MSYIIMTGCSQSIGAHISHKLEMQGHDVFGVGKGGPDLEQDFREFAGRDPIVMDEFAEYVFGEAMRTFNGHPPNVLIHNAGITEIEWLSEHTSEQFENVLTVNAKVAFALCSQFAKIVERFVDPKAENDDEEIRKIIFTSSMGVYSGLRASPGYVASKAAMEAVSRTIAREMTGAMPIMTLSIALAGIENTAMIEQCVNELIRTRGMTQRAAEEYVKKPMPMGRLMTYDEVWAIYDFAVNMAPQHMSGSVIKCPGGSGQL